MGYLGGLLIKTWDWSEEDKAGDRPSLESGLSEDEEEEPEFGYLDILRIAFCNPSIAQSSRQRTLKLNQPNTNPNPTNNWIITSKSLLATTKPANPLPFSLSRHCFCYFILLFLFFRGGLGGCCRSKLGFPVFLPIRLTFPVRFSLN